jgi:hypothetical protein
MIPLTVIFGLLAMGGAVVIYGTLVKNRWGINAGNIACQRCHTSLPKVRQPQSLREELWGGCTCTTCGAELDKWGRELQGGTSRPKTPRPSLKDEQTKEPLQTTFLDRFRPRSHVSWVVAVVLILLNTWYDYYHPLGIIFDVVLAVVLLIWYLSKSPPV